MLNVVTLTTISYYSSLSVSISLYEKEKDNVRESRGTQTRDRLRWWCPAVTEIYKSDFSSEEDNQHHQTRNSLKIKEKDLGYFNSVLKKLTDLESREYCLRDPSRWPRGTLSTQNLVLTSPTSSGRSVGIVLSRTQAMESS
jgi:hypothetical protein